MAVKIVSPAKDAPQRDYRGREVEMPEKYRGEDGQERWRDATYEPTECDGVIDGAVTQARMRLARGDDPAAVQDWLAEQVRQAAEDAAARQRFARTSQLTLSEDPAATRAACARSLARVVVLEWERNRRR